MAQIFLMINCDKDIDPSKRLMMIIVRGIGDLYHRGE
jgi:hypothetical protein